MNSSYIKQAKPKLFVIFYSLFIMILVSTLSMPVMAFTGRSLSEEPITSQTCSEWNLASEYKVYPDQQNPNPDSCGYADVWHFYRSDSNRHTFTLLDAFTNSVWGVTGLQDWGNTNPDQLPVIGKNATGVDQQRDTEFFPTGVVYAHPSLIENASVGWKSPFNAFISVSGFVKDLNPGLNCSGHGIKWFIKKGSVDMVSGSITTEGGTQNFVDGTGGNFLSSIPIRAGEYLYFIIDPNGDACADATQLDIHVQLVSSITLVYLPIISKPAKLVPALIGNVKNNGNTASGIPLDLRFYNGTSWSTLATTTTAANGSYSFTNVSPLSAGQKYYVRFLNDSDDSKLYSWHTKTITAYDGASIVEFEPFDIANITLLSPDPGATVSLPATFSWTPRPATPLDSYEFNLFDPQDWDPLFYTDPPLGYVSSYRLQSLPAGFSKETLYGWTLYIYSLDGGYGVSYYYYDVMLK